MRYASTNVIGSRTSFVIQSVRCDIHRYVYLGVNLKINNHSLVKTTNKRFLIKSINNLTHMKSINNFSLVKTILEISIIKLKKSFVVAS